MNIFKSKAIHVLDMVSSTTMQLTNMYIFASFLPLSFLLPPNLYRLSVVYTWILSIFACCGAICNSGDWIILWKSVPSHLMKIHISASYGNPYLRMLCKSVWYSNTAIYIPIIPYLSTDSVHMEFFIRAVAEEPVPFEDQMLTSWRKNIRGWCITTWRNLLEDSSSEC